MMGCGMKSILTRSFLVLALVVGSSTYVHAETVSVAYGGTFDQVITFLFGWLIGNGQQKPERKPDPPKTNLAPEIDPASGLGALLFVGGTLTVLRSRRRV
jgi:hypothetical protein